MKHSEYVIKSKAFTCFVMFDSSGKCVRGMDPLKWMVGDVKAIVRKYCNKRGWIFRLKREGG